MMDSETQGTGAVLWLSLIISVVPVLIGLALRDWWKSADKGPRTKVIPTAVAFAVLADWACYVLTNGLGSIPGSHTHSVGVQTGGWLEFLSLGLVVAALVGKVARWKLAVAGFLVAASWAASQMVIA